MNARVQILGVVHDMPAEDYHAVEALSATGLRVLARSAWHYRHRVNVEPTRPMLRGTLAHCVVLEPDAMADRYVVVPEGAPRRPTAAQWAAKKPSPESMSAMEWWRGFNTSAEGRQIVSAADYSNTLLQLRAVADEPVLSGILSAGRGEVSVFWVDEETGVYCKARPDWLNDSENELMVLDLKTTADESPNGFGRAAARMKYHIQAAHYTAGIEATMKRKVREFVFGAVTSEPPVLAVPYMLADDLKEQAADERRELLDLYARCQRENHWPAYGQGLQLLDFPAYAKRDSELEVFYAD